MELELLKVSVGVDVSKDSLSVCLGSLHYDLSRSFEFMEDQPNDLKGFKRILNWIRHSSKGMNPVVLMEATGIYHENLAHYLYSSGIDVSIMQSGRVKRYAQSLPQRSKTDLLDSKMLSMLALDRALVLWDPPRESLRNLKGLSRERFSLVHARGIAKNRNHALTISSYESKTATKRFKSMMKLYDKQIKEIEEEMALVITRDKELKEKMSYLQSIPGVSFIASATVVAETLGFTGITNGKQLASYVGYDVVLRESGMYRGRSTISKKGNKYIRAILHMPSMAVIRVNPTLKPFYQRLKEKKPKPLIGLIATQRKLLLLMYALWKKGEMYDSEFEIKKAASLKGLAAQDSKLEIQLTS